jgi:hypothetical protein
MPALDITEIGKWVRRQGSSRFLATSKRRVSSDLISYSGSGKDKYAAELFSPVFSTSMLPEV